MTTFNDSGVITLPATGAIPKYSVVKIVAGKATIAVAADGLLRIGITQEEAFVADQKIPVKLLNKGGTQIGIARTAIAAGAAVYGAAAGKLDTVSLAQTHAGVAISAAGADLDHFEFAPMSTRLT